jgi:putative ABC transport system permease protein
LRTRSAVFTIQRAIERPHAEPLTAVLPGVALDQLWSLLGQGERILLLMIALVGLTALVGLVATTLTGLEARRRELAILRALGARPQTLFALVLIESSIVALLGSVAGVAVSATLLSVLAGPLQGGLGLVLDKYWLTLHQGALLLIVFCSVLAAGTVPALRAARMSLADGLAPPH